jgi:hypothetical protein
MHLQREGAARYIYVREMPFTVAWIYSPVECDARRDRKERKKKKEFFGDGGVGQSITLVVSQLTVELSSFMFARSCLLVQ